MNHITHIRFVNSHSESIRRNDNRGSVIDKIILILLPGFIGKPGMISGDRNPSFKKQFKQIVHIFSCSAIDDSTFCWMFLYVLHDEFVFSADVFNTVI